MLSLRQAVMVHVFTSHNTENEKELKAFDSLFV